MIAKSNSSLTVTLPSDREIVLTRAFDAPRSLVFEAVTRPENIQRWWGPRDQSFVSCEMDFRVGGAWRFVQRDSSGNEWAFKGHYREIAPPERVVQTFEFEGMPGHISVDTMTLDERDGKTIMTSHSLFASPEDRDGMLQSGMESGATEAYDRLAELLATLA